MLSMSDARREARRELAHEVDPLLLAESFLGEEEYWFDDEATGTCLYRLRKWRGGYFYWADGRYREVREETVRINLAAWLQKDLERVRAKLGVTYQVTRELVGNILLNLDPLIAVGETCELNSWLDFQERPLVIGLRNGLLSLADFDKGAAPRLLGHTPDYFNTACLPFDYDPQADCPLWKHFLDDVMLGRADLIAMLQQWVGYLFRPDLREQKFLLCVGEGANGKGVFFEVVQALVGRDNCSQVPLCRFGNPFALWPTFGKLLNATSESTHIIEEEAEGILKAFVAGDAFTFERKYRDPFHATPTTKVMIATNALPHFNDKTQGIVARLRRPARGRGLRRLRPVEPGQRLPTGQQRPLRTPGQTALPQRGEDPAARRTPADLVLSRPGGPGRLGGRRRRGERVELMSPVSLVSQAICTRLPGRPQDECPRVSMKISQ